MYCSKFCSYWQVGTQVRTLSVLLLAIWMIVLVDLAIETNQTLFILTAVGCVYSLVLNTYIFFAIKNALYDARAAAGEDKYFLLNAPATPEKIRMSVVDDYTSAGVDWNFQAKASI